MNLFNISTIRSRTIRICFNYALILNLILLVSIVSGRPKDGELSYELRNFRTVKRHPAVFYKEDYVSEDYAQEKTADDLIEMNNKKEENHKLHKNFTNKLQKPEKVMFDFFPTDSIDLKKDVKMNDNVKVEIISLFDDQIDNKRKHRHKKYNHNRARRNVKSLDNVEQDRIYRIFDTSFSNPKVPEESHTHQIQRRNYNSYATANAVTNTGNQVFTLSSQYPVRAAPMKYAIRGIYYNPFPPGAVSRRNVTNPETVGVRFDADEDKSSNKDMFLWVVNYPTRRPSVNQVTPRPGRRPPPPLIHNSSPNQVTPPTTRRPPPALSQGPTTPRPTRRPQPPVFQDLSSDFGNRDRQTDRETQTRRPPPPLIHDSSSNVRPTVASPIETPPSQSGSQRSELSQCVWAIVSCCQRRNTEVRYNCFEQNGCSGAFWGLNPCADNIQDIALNAADQYFD